MRDSRVDFLDQTTIDSSATLNSDSVDLLDGYVGDHLLPVGEYGIGVRAVVTDIAGTSYTLALKIQESDNDSTWYDLSSWDTVNPPTAVKGQKIVFEKRLQPNRRYIRLVATSANVGGGESCKIRADIADGTTCQGNVIRYA